MIIGFAGKKQHGKDTAVKMWDFLDNCRIDAALNDFPFENIAFFENYLGWKVPVKNNLKFADKLKDIVCMLTGCTREQLEQDDFKNSNLPSMWDYWVIGNPTADEHYNHIEPQEYSKHFKTEKECAEYLKEDSDLRTNSNFVPCKRSFTYRRLLQEIGTELFRTFVHPDTWVNATMTEAVSMEYCYISDVRFPNEVKAVEDNKGIVIRVECTDKESQDSHASEIALDDYKFAFKIAVPLGLENLFNGVKEIYKYVYYGTK